MQNESTSILIQSFPIEAVVRDFSGSISRSDSPDSADWLISIKNAKTMAGVVSAMMLKSHLRDDSRPSEFQNAMPDRLYRAIVQPSIDSDIYHASEIFDKDD
jgi:hypothetical protein